MMAVPCLAVFVFILFVSILILSATGSECTIYVSSSNGISNASCWTGGYQTPCATLDLALQGTATDAIQDNCSSGIVIYLSPGTYTLDTGLMQLICMTIHEVSLSSLCMNDSSLPTPSHNSLVTESNCQLALNITFINLPLYCDTYYYECGCDYLRFTASIIDSCSGKTYDWYNDLQVCLMEPSLKFPSCYNVSLVTNVCCHFPSFKLPTCFDSISSSGPIEAAFFIKTLELININTSVSTNLTFDVSICNKSDLTYCPPCLTDWFDDSNIDDCYDDDDEYVENCCVVSHTGYMCQNCTSGIPINMLNTCAHCTNYPLSILIFIGIEILPMTIMVLLIIVLNIQLTNGSINGLVLYSQMALILFPEYIYTTGRTIGGVDYYFNSIYFLWLLALIPRIIFNLDFTPLLYNSIPLCITPNMSPLGAISFWYVIGFYPLLLLLLIYVWIVLYDKGFRCVVCITRPFHRCMARFWSMTGIEPSLIHSIASIYILCCTQLAVVSFKILSFNYIDNNSAVFFFDAKQEYFKGFHALAGSFAILVLLFLILLPTLFIQFYPFKWFHKLLDYLKLRKQLLISLGDVFTGPYKNGSNNTFDYRYTCGLFLLAKVIIMFQFTFMCHGTLYVAMLCCFSLLILIVLIFRPFKRNIHNFCEVVLLLAIVINYILLALFEIQVIFLWIFNGLVFVIILPGYSIYHLYKMAANCYCYYKQLNHTVPDYEEQDEENQPLVDGDWIADRMENPQEYDEQHVPVRLDDFSQEYHQLNINTAAATYGSINSDQ